MKRNVELKIASLLSLLFLTFHLADDAVRGWFPGGFAVVYAALASGVLLYGILILGERRSGLLLMLVVSLFAIAMPIMHSRGAGVGAVAKASGGFFFVWTLVALGALGIFSFILSVHALWRSRSSQAR